MRKIEQTIVETIKAQRADVEASIRAGITVPRCVKAINNTRIETGMPTAGAVVTSVYLHGNLIAQTDFAGNWGFKMCGWPTPTTRSRINTICREFGYVGVNQSKGKQWCGSTEISANDWFWPRKSC